MPTTEIIKKTLHKVAGRYARASILESVDTAVPALFVGSLAPHTASLLTGMLSVSSTFSSRNINPKRQWHRRRHSLPPAEATPRPPCRPAPRPQSLRTKSLLSCVRPKPTKYPVDSLVSPTPVEGKPCTIIRLVTYVKSKSKPSWEREQGVERVETAAAAAGAAQVITAVYHKKKVPR